MKRVRGRGFIFYGLVGLVAIVLVFSIFSYGVLAADAGAAQSVSAGMTPNNIFYGFKLWGESRAVNSAGTPEEKIALEAQYLKVRYAEMRQLVENGDVDAKIAAEGAGKIYSNIGSYAAQIVDEKNVDVAQIQSADGSFHKLSSIEVELLQIDNSFNDIKTLALEKAASGEISKDAADSIILPAELGKADFGSSISNEKNGIVNHLSESMPSMQAEAIVAKAEESSGAENGYKENVNQKDIEGLRDKIDELNQKAKVLEEKGDSEGSAAVKTLSAHAELDLQKSEYSIENGIYGKAYGQLTSAEYLILNAEKKITDGTIDANYVKGTIGAPVDAINSEIAGEGKRSGEVIKSYEDESLRKDFESKYPEYKSYYNEEYNRAKKSQELVDNLRGNGIVDKWFNELKAEGLSDEQAAAKLSEKFAGEFENVYGKEYVPPGFVKPVEGSGVEKGGEVKPEVIPIGRIQVNKDPETGEKRIVGWNVDGALHENVAWGGGFVRGVEYNDPATGNKYTFDGGIYRYTTPAGSTYEESYPSLGKEGKAFDPTNDFQKGDEVYKYEYRNSDGNIVEYSYSATGYEAGVKGISAESAAGGATGASGTAGSDVAKGADEKVSYPTGTYVVEGGGRIEESPTGFVHVDKGGLLSEWDYDPNYKTYINPETGKVFAPDVSYHEEAINYDSVDKEYKYSGPEGEWKYKEDGKWESPTGEVKKSYVPAPVGYEDKKEYITPSGENWKYDGGSSTWNKFDSAGAKVESYVPPPNHYASYDGKEGKYVDYKGNTYSSEQWKAGASKVDPSGKAWNYNSATGTWDSSDGAKYDPKTGVSGEGGKGGVDYGKSLDPSGKEVRSYNYNYGYNVYNPDGSLSYYSSAGVTTNAGSNVGGQQSYVDGSGRTWAKSGDGTWTSSDSRAAVGTTTTYNGEKYTVDANKGWINSKGEAVPPPPGQQSSVGGGNYNTYTGGPGYSASPHEGAYSPSGSGTGVGGHIYVDGKWKEADLNNPTDKAIVDAAQQAGNVWGGGSSYGGTYGSGYSSGGASVGTTATYNGKTYTVDANKGWVDDKGNPVPPPQGQPSSAVGGSYSGGGYNSPGCTGGGCGAGYGNPGYTGSGSYNGGSGPVSGSGSYGSSGYSGSGSYSGSSYSGSGYSGSGSYSGGSYSGGSGGSYSGGGSSGSEGSGGGSYSGGSSGGSGGGSSGGSSGGGSSGGGDSGGGSYGGGGYVVKEFEASGYGFGSAVGYMFKRIF